MDKILKWVEQAFKGSFYKWLIICFFLVVLARATVVLIAFQHSNESQFKNRQAINGILKKVEGLDKLSADHLTPWQQETIRSIREDAHTAIKENDNLEIIHNQLLR